MKININKKNIIIVLVIACLLTIGLLGIKMIKTSKEEIKPESLRRTKIQSNIKQKEMKYNYSGSLELNDKMIKVYKIENDKKELDMQEVMNLMRKLNFEGEITEFEGLNGKDFYIINESGEYITLYEKPRYFDYSNNVSPTGAKLTKDELIAIANQYIEKVNFLDEQIMFDFYNSVYYFVPEIGEGWEKTNSSKANYLEVVYKISLDGKKILSSKQQLGGASVLLTLDGRIQKATVNLFDGDIIEIGENEINRIDQAIEALNDELGTIISLRNIKNNYDLDVENRTIETADLNKVEVVYIYDPEIDNIQPYFKFSGSGETTEKEVVALEVIVNALPEDLYIK
jgi:hypothetical protein